MLNRRAVAGVLIGAGLLGALWLSGCERRPEGREKPARDAIPTPKPKGTLKAEFQKARVIWDDEDGTRVWDAGFQKAVASETGERAVVELQGVRAHLYRQGKVASTMTADRVVADSRSREVRATGGVRVSAPGASAASDRLVWKARQDKLFGAGGVVMTRGNLTIKARTFQADTSLKKASFTDAEMSLR